MHYECVLDDALTKVFERLGTDMPQPKTEVAVQATTSVVSTAEPNADQGPSNVKMENGDDENHVQNGE